MRERQPEKHDFFIEYDDADVQWAEWIAHQLEKKAHYKVFCRKWDIPPSKNAALEIHKVLQNIDVRIILVFSPSYQQENSSIVATALSKGHLLPIQVYNCSVSGPLSSITFIDLVGVDEEEARRRLLNGVTTKRPTTSPNYPGSTYGQEGMKQPLRYPGNPPPIWHVPLRNSIFTDRGPALTKLYEIFKEGQEGQILTHVINGLGGVGKSQVAVEYAHRYKHLYDAVLWIDVSNEETILKDLTSLEIFIPSNLKPNNKTSKTSKMTNLQLATKQWLQASGAMRWLLILDNIPNFALINDFIPSGGNGHILMTARAQAIGTIAPLPQYLPEMSLEDGALLLLRRAKKSDSQVLLQDISNADLVKQALEISRLMGNLPLALDQVGAYIEGVDEDLSEYLENHNDSNLRFQLLEEGKTIDYPNPVATTWDDAFTKVREANPDAYSLLLFCSVFHHQTIPEELIIRGATTLPIFQTWAYNHLPRKKAYAELRKYSLLLKEDKTKTFSMHPLVQVALRESLTKAEQRQWSECAIISVYTCCQYVIQKWRIVSNEYIRLLNLIDTYLHNHACNLETRSTVELDATPIIKALEEFSTHLQTVGRVQEAKKLNAFADLIRAVLHQMPILSHGV